MSEENRITDFNSSQATLIRVDTLINQLHYSSRISGAVNQEYYLRTLDRLYIEGQCKFNPKEKEICLEFQKHINDLKLKWGNSLINEFKKNNKEKKNPRFIDGWNEVMPLARDYEITLMGFLDAHGMLLSEKKKINLKGF